MREQIQFYINGERFTAEGEDAFLMVGDYLRNRLRKVGTKISCAEGDCGACTIIQGTPRQQGGEWTIDYRPVNSCILPMAAIDGCHLITIEGLKEHGCLSVIQDAFVEANGTQCGFCTPGMVMALTGLFEKTESITQDDVLRGLAGNLCRCTGYEGILKVTKCVDQSRHVRLAERWNDPDLIQELANTFTSPFRVVTEEKIVTKVCSLDEALNLKKQDPAIRIVAGATDLGVIHNKRRQLLTRILYLGPIPELEGIQHCDDHITFGARVRISDFHAAVADRVPHLAPFLDDFASWQIKNSGTVVGNLVNASPVGDLIPVLLALDAEVTVARQCGRRQIPLKDFYRGYKDIDLTKEEIVTQVRFTVPAPDDITRFYKVSKRKSLDISAVSAAFRLRLEGKTIKTARLAFGGVGPTACRLKETEEWLLGRSFSQETFAEAAQRARAEVKPISDIRGGEHYRQQLVENLLLKFFAEEEAHG